MITAKAMGRDLMVGFILINITKKRERGAGNREQGAVNREQ